MKLHSTHIETADGSKRVSEAGTNSGYNFHPQINIDQTTLHTVYLNRNLKPAAIAQATSG